MKPITFVTSNQHKAREVGQMLGIPLTHVALELDELQSMDLKEIIEHKAKAAYRALKRPIIVEDVGLYVDAWNGFPGPFIKWVGLTIGYDKLHSFLPKARRGAAWVVGYGWYNGKRFHYAEGRLRGKIGRPAHGTDGWGFDIVLIPAGYTKTFAELGMDVKNKISARGLALKKLKRFLRSTTS